jgi:hypothetical protein
VRARARHVLAGAPLTLSRRHSFSTALLSRERTIVINLEHVKARRAAARQRTRRASVAPAPARR